MPYKTEKLSIECPFMDNRSKLLPCQKEMVLHYSNLGYSQRKIAAMFNVSRRLITFIIAPDKLKKNYQARVDRGGSAAYYNRQKNNDYQKKHRRRKHQLLSNLISDNETNN